MDVEDEILLLRRDYKKLKLCMERFLVWKDFPTDLEESGLDQMAWEYVENRYPKETK